MNRSLIEYISNDYWNEIGDQRVAKLPLLTGGPLPVLCIIVFYLITVKACEHFMKNQNAMDLRLFMALYNLFLVHGNGIGFLIALHLTNFGLKTWFCEPVNQNDHSLRSMLIIYLGYGYFILKFIDLTDTIIFSLRKKSNQVTFLHCFHHSVMPLTAWFGLKIHPGGMTGFTPLVNSFVHTAMHFYYCLSALGPIATPFLWWKKYITILQLMQFIAIFIHAIHTFFVVECSWPPLFAVLEAAQALLFFLMFYNFYRNCYTLKQD